MLDDVLSEFVFNLLSEWGEATLGSKRFLCMRAFGAGDDGFEFSSRAFKDVNTCSSGSGANPKNRLLCAENVREEREFDLGPSEA